MNEFELQGIDGSNPLGFLAALGVLRAVAVQDPQCKMSWHTDAAPPRPTLHTALDENGVADAVLAEAELACKVVDELGSTHISATPPDKYRNAARKWIDNNLSLPGVPSPTDYFAAFTCDALAAISKKGKDVAQEDSKNDGKTLPFSQLSFSNGASGQLLFKDFRNLVRLLLQPSAPVRPRRKGQTAVPSTPAPSGRALVIANILNGASHMAADKAQSMNWDPGSRRAYALRWVKPEKENKAVDVPLNVCAFLGFASLTSLPVGDELKTCGFDRANRWFHWQLSEVPVPYAVALAQVTAPTLPGGVAWASERINPDGKRYYFAPAACQG
ncbi:MAG: hypothetical protein J6333_10345 [Planctomycetes bacterium]|nr:hypothetical protein [Planctomycetota bacterium]